MMKSRVQGFGTIKGKIDTKITSSECVYVRVCKHCVLGISVIFPHSIVRVIKARRIRWAGHVARMGEVRGAYNILVGRPDGRRPLGRPRRRWEDNIKIDLREIGFGDVDWIHWAHDRNRWRALVNMVMNLRVP
jgi:hypothetical protein